MNKLIIVMLCCFSFSVSAFDGVVAKREFRISAFVTEKGDKIPDVILGYETYGELNADKSNVILVTHHYSGNSHVAGKYKDTDMASGYWDSIIGAGLPLDTNKFFVISVDSLVNVGTKDPFVRTTGPMSINPKTKKPYGKNFPGIVINDFVRAQRELLNSLGIKKLYAVAGASSGAAQAAIWAALYPQDVPRAIAVVGPGLSLPPYVVALLNRWCAPILLDSKKGLVESLKLLTLSSVYFDWGPQDANKIEAAFHERALARAAVMDPLSFVYTARAIQAFNVEALADKIQAKFLFIPAEKDMIFPVELSKKTADKLKSLGKSAEVFVLKGRGGHLDGLTQISQASDAIKKFLQ